MQDDMGIADKTGCWFWDLARAACVIAREPRQNALICSLWWLEVIDCNKTACRTTWALPTKWGYWFWDRMRPARIVAREACQNTLICSLWLLEVIDCNENLHEGGHGLCQRNDVNGFGMARV